MRCLADTGSRRAWLWTGLLLPLLLTSSTARADVSSWFYVGSGPSLVGGRGHSDLVPALQLEAGMGTAPSEPWVIGALFRTNAEFGQGVEIAQLARLAQRDFVNGDWGFAFDLGVSERLWSPWPALATGSVVVGGPWGLTLSLTGAYGADEASLVQATVGVDLLRLTVYRRSGGEWWPNLFPAYRPEAADSPE